MPDDTSRAAAPKLPRTLLVILSLMVITAGGYLIANLLQPDRFAERTECVGSSPDGPINTCDYDIVLAVCTSDQPQRACFAQTLEPQEIFVPAVAHRSDEIRTEYAACEAPYIPTTVSDPRNASIKLNGCRAPE